MSNNYIEEFFISIGFDTKKVKKEAKEIDKVLDSLVNKKRKSVTVESKARVKAYKAQRANEADNFKFFLKKEQEKQKAINKTLAQSVSTKEGNKATEKLKDPSQRKNFIKKKKEQATLVKAYKAQRANEADNFKFFLKKEGEKSKSILRTTKLQKKSQQDIANSRIKQAVAGITSKSGAGNAKESAAIFKKSFDLEGEVKTSEKMKRESQRKRFIKKKKEQATLAQLKKKEEAKLAKQAKADLMERLRIFKGAKISSELSRGVNKAGAQRRAETMRGSKAYRTAQRSGNLGSIGSQITAAASIGNMRELGNLQDKLSAVNRETTKLTKSQRKQTVVQKGLNDSTRNMIRSYASVFALFQGTVAIKRIGQDFQGMEAAMLAASGSAPAAAKDLKFVSEVVDEMGLNLKDSTDAFVKLKFAAKGKMDNSQIEALFKSVNQFGTALKVAPEDQKRAMRGLQQMLSKGKVMAEELKNQLGDALPASIQIFARALSMSEAELFKAMESGSLLSAEVLPKVAKEFERAALEGGAYATALKGLRTTEGKFLTESQRAGDKIFKSGFSAGLANLYETLSKILKDSSPQLEKFGKAFGIVFKGIAYILEKVTPLLKVVIDQFEWIFGAIMLTKIYSFARGIQVATKATALFSATTATGMAAALAPITAVLAAFAAVDDWLANYDATRVSIKEAAQGFQVINGEKVSLKEKDGKYYSGASLGKLPYKGATMQRGGSLASQMRGMDYGQGSSNQNSSKEVKLTVDITGVPTQEIANQIEAHMSGWLPSNMAGMSQ